jgi:hypothetical protein
MDPRRWFFVTLTYPGEWSRSAEDWKRDLDTWWKRWIRRWGAEWSAFWKVEPQKRGAPHFHLIVMPTEGQELDYSATFSWLSRSWYEVVGSSDERHLRAGTRIERVRTYNGAISYAAKYCGKVCAGFVNPETGEAVHVGRYWGVLGRGGLRYDHRRYRLSESSYYRVRRVLRKKWRGVGRGLARGFVSFCGADELVRLVVWAGAWELGGAAADFFCADDWQEVKLEAGLERDRYGEYWKGV